MDSHQDTDETYHSEPEVSSNRPPQFNGSNCGYRCGWGCCEPNASDDEGGGSESSAPTLVDPLEDDGRAPSLVDADDDDDDDDDDHDENAEQQSEVAVVVEAEDGAQTIAYLENNLHHPSVSSHRYLSPSGSLEDDASSGAHSDVPCDRRHIIDLTMSDILRGITDRMEDLPFQRPQDDQAGPALSRTLFLLPPLRLSAQYEHCRGNPYRHMAIRDDMVLRI
ncbi:hypothetical protein FB567DRAFT_51805 [Paraphoma chrysanthemicola]|uniref:Uncharacterized protein n=1 Tax=Paraphoma chrysanthemicola TaxID=798071 RepID=A0A8K0VY46_9PLEO|nr:hypothetical protein FB567DRAFT_51805 [Paraphoma chrysanthemicola]